jgi:small subunit ribosomal protein S21
MGVRLRVHDREPIGQALRRFRKLLAREGLTWDRRRHIHFLDPTQLRRARRFRKRFKARKATLEAQRAGQQPVRSLAEATATFWRRTGKP